MKVLGIDPGAKHCGLCVYDVGEDVITRWAIADIDASSAKAMVLSLDAAISGWMDDGVVGVAVERQPPKNAQMLKCMYYLEGYMAHRYPDVWYVTVTPQKRHAFVKKETTSSGEPSSYASRKKASVAYVQGWLEQRLEKNQAALEVLSRHAKKDDLCESFLVARIAAGRASQRRDQK
jgi:hypothetical protein